MASCRKASPKPTAHELVLLQDLLGFSELDF